MHESFNQVLDIIFPHSLRLYFELTNYVQKNEQLHFYLQEINDVPFEFKEEKLISKGFYDEATVQDFPIRGCQVFFHIKRRRWLNELTGQLVQRNWDLLAKGTRITQEFADFLKEISR
jgi:hypothetical protein